MQYLPSAAQSSITGGPEVRCGALRRWSEHSWQRAVCQPTVFTSSGCWTDTWSLCRVISEEKSLQNVFCCQRRNKKCLKMPSHTRDGHLLTQLVLNLLQFQLVMFILFICGGLCSNNQLHLQRINFWNHTNSRWPLWLIQFSKHTQKNYYSSKSH